MNCLDNYIGVRGCSPNVPESGLYINDIPGVRTLLAARVVDEEHITGTQLLQSCVKRAYRLAINDLVTALAAEDYILLPERSMEQNGKRVNRKHKAGQNFRFDVCAEGTNEYETIYWDKVRLYASADGNVTITITQGTEIKTVTIAVVEGEGTYPVETELDRSAKITVNADVDLDYYGGTCDCICIGTAPFWPWLNLRPDMDTFVCRYRQVFTNAFFYRAGIEFAQEVLHSPRVNDEARSAKERASRLLLELRGGTDPQIAATSGVKAVIQGLYPNALDAAVNGIKGQITKGKVGIFSCERARIYYVTP